MARSVLAAAIFSMSNLPSTLAVTGQFEEFLHMTWPCTEWTFTDETIWTLINETKAGAPIWISDGGVKGDGRYHYLFFDVDCDADGAVSTGAWLLSPIKPDTCLAEDIDRDGKCSGHGAKGSSNMVMPPSGTWHIYCCDPDLPGCQTTPAHLDIDPASSVETEETLNAADSFPDWALDLPHMCPTQTTLTTAAPPTVTTIRTTETTTFATHTTRTTTSATTMSTTRTFVSATTPTTTRVTVTLLSSSTRSSSTMTATTATTRSATTTRSDTTTQSETATTRSATTTRSDTTTQSETATTSTSNSVTGTSASSSETESATTRSDTATATSQTTATSTSITTRTTLTRSTTSATGTSISGTWTTGSSVTSRTATGTATGTTTTSSTETVTSATSTATRRKPWVMCIDLNVTTEAEIRAGDANVSVSDSTWFRVGDVLHIVDDSNDEVGRIDGVGAGWISVEEPLANDFSAPTFACLASTRIPELCPGQGIRCAVLSASCPSGATSVETHDPTVYSVGDTIEITDLANSETSTVVSIGSMGLSGPLKRGFSHSYTIVSVLPDPGVTVGSMDGGQLQASSELVVIVMAVCILCFCAFCCCFCAGKRGRERGRDEKRGAPALSGDLRGVDEEIAAHGAGSTGAAEETEEAGAGVAEEVESGGGEPASAPPHQGARLDLDDKAPGGSPIASTTLSGPVAATELSDSPEPFECTYEDESTSV